ncbi:MAG TPA: Rieske 2Fe-2S domain-containing protein [Dehalococcoidia bacterium]|nr:Rieske 2Fe-2S domain-containing protein [Dehalococcoidia bacterium]
MLSENDNDLMCQVGPGTPMGAFIREYWIPAVMSSELPAGDTPPMRLRLLGEDLIAFRATSGDVGLVANACPHRGASLFFGRNEEDGLRCVYHGWKFDVTGNCVDMPSEPAESNFKSKVHAKAYPCQERNGIVWTYMGSRTIPPPLPRLPGNLSDVFRVTKSVRDCSYMQALEGDIDTVHWGFLHAGHVRPDECDPGSTDYYATRIRNATIQTEVHEAGTTYGAFRPAEADSDYWRIGHFLLPFYTYNAPGVLTRKFGCTAWVPIDDDHMMVWNIATPLPESVTSQPGIGGLKMNLQARRGGGGQNDRRRLTQPDTTDWIGKFRSVQSLDNDYLIDRDAQRINEIYSGIPNGAEPQDRGMQESMGPIYDRTQEHLGTSDGMVIVTRRKLLNACKAFAETGAPPPGVDNPDIYWMFSGGALVPKGVNGIEYTRDVLYGRAPAIEVMVGGGGG